MTGIARRIGVRVGSMISQSSEILGAAAGSVLVRSFTGAAGLTVSIPDAVGNLPWLAHAYGAHLSVASTQLLDERRIYLYFNVLHIYSPWFVPAAHLR